MNLSLCDRRANLIPVGLVTALVFGVASAGAPALAAAPANSSGSISASRATIDPALRSQSGVLSVLVSGRSGTEATRHAGLAAGSTTRLTAAVRRAGGVVVRELPSVDAVAAQLPDQAINRLAADPGVGSLTLNARMAVQADPPSGSDPDQLPSVYRQVVRADQVGTSGQGQTVALVDTGVTALPDVADRLVSVGGQSCVNFSGQPTCDDQYGHGTFLAGLIAGTGAASAGQYVGVAPQANILSVKIAGPDGSSDVSTVIAAISWVVAHKDAYGIRVLNLSLGTDSTQSARLDPLNKAVELAWQNGVVVVVAASNRGPAAGTISKPGDDPYVLTVGAVDDQGSVPTDDDLLPAFSSRGPTAADGLDKPDVVAPGAHLVSLAAPGASITSRFPCRMPAPYRRGSGTSMATAVVSGVVADLLAANPSMTPDRVKFALMATARPDASTDREAVGAGLVDAAGALNAPAGVANQSNTPSSGLGSLQGSRGTLTVTLHVGLTSPVLSGEVTAQLQAWNPLAFLLGGLLAFTGSNWYGSNWYGSNWYGSNWYGATDYGSNWYGSNWYGSNWYGSNWYGAWDQ